MRGTQGAASKRTSPVKAKAKPTDALAPEYRFDYAKAKPNRFVDKAKPAFNEVLLDPDVARVFKTGEAVNAVLRALMVTMPGGRGARDR